MNHLNRHLSWMAAALLLAATQARAEDAVPARFAGAGNTGAKAKFYGPDPRLELGLEGSIELWLKADAESEVDQPTCVLAHGDTRENRNFRVMLKGNRRSIALVQVGDAPPRPGDVPGALPEALSAPCNFADGDWHHIVFTVAGTYSRAFVDGKPVGEPAPFSFRPPSPDGRRLVVGGDWTTRTDQQTGNQYGFKGQLLTVRLWNEALAAPDVTLLKADKHYGALPKDHPLHNRLAAYVDFRADGFDLAYGAGDLKFTDWVGAPGGESLFAPRLGAGKAMAVGVRLQTGGVADVLVQHGLPDPRGRVPVLWPRPPADKAAAVAQAFGKVAAARAESAEKQALLAAGSRDKAALPPGKTLTDLAFDANGAQIELVKSVLGYNRAVVGVINLKDLASGSSGWNVYELDAAGNETIIGVTGKQNGDLITALGFETNKSFAGVYSRAGAGDQAFSLRLPAGTKYQGLVVRRSARGVHGIRLAYSALDVAPADLTVASPRGQGLNLAAGRTGGRYVRRESEQPVRVDSPFVKHLCAYENYPVYRFQFDPPTGVLTLHRDAFEEPMARLEFSMDPGPQGLSVLDRNQRMDQYLERIKVFDDLRRTRWGWGYSEPNDQPVLMVYNRFVPLTRAEAEATAKAQAENPLRAGVDRLFGRQLPFPIPNQWGRTEAERFRGRPWAGGAVPRNFTWFVDAPYSVAYHALQHFRDLPPLPNNKNGAAIPQLTLIRSREFESIRSEQFTHKIGNVWESKSGNQLVVGSDGDESLRLKYDVNDPKSPAVNLIRPADYKTGDDGKLSWANAFVKDGKPRNWECSYYGYNLLTLHPRDLLNARSRGSSRKLFREPDPKKAEYDIVSNIYTPWGMYLDPSLKGKEKSATHTSASGSEFASKTSHNVGTSFGCPGIFSCSANTTWGQNVNQSNNAETMTTTTVTAVKRFTMILDRSHASLNAERNQFAARVLEMRNEMRAGRQPDFVAFFKEFGTHYPYAATYGGAAYLDIRFTQNEWKSVTEDFQSYEVKAEATIEGLNIGGSGGSSSSTTNGLSGKVSDNKITFKTYGGSQSTGQSWSVPQGEEVPILMDLRPQFELLSPVFFDDPFIWTTLRGAMRQAFLNYVDETVKTERPPWLHTPSRAAWAESINRNKP